MIRSVAVIFSTLFLLCGCAKNSEDGPKYHDDGRRKPSVAFVPVFDRSGSELPWNLSDEITETMYQRFYKRNSVYLTPPQNVYQIINQFDSHHNPFTEDLSWVKKSFKDSEFVVFAELIEHNVHQKPEKNSFVDKITPSCQLDMTMRLRVVDIREETPRIALQEILRQSHSIPKPSQDKPNSEEPWRRKTYAVSPLGFAHMQMTKEAVERAEAYILLSKNQ